MGKRALRRHHKQRMKARARWVAKTMWHYPEDQLQHADHFGDYITACSCSGCGNPRQRPWRYRTLQEMNSELDFKEQMKGRDNG